MDEFWKQALPVKKHIKELSSYHTFYMISLHGWRHNLDSPKYFLDIIQLLHLLHDEIDYSLLFQDASRHKTIKRIIRTLSIIYQQFPHLDQIKKFPYKRKNIIWESNSFKKKNRKSIKKYADFIDYQFFSYDSARHSFIEMLKWIAPSEADLVTHLEKDKQKSQFKYILLSKKRFINVVKMFFLPTKGC
ncbi:hypothetical protein [Bacillus sp. V33-4]|uniref:hypothetical protein n=1 Tax=Bacillus sp. V33-4 TaxID=2054169 RepID=UPI0035B5394C